ncbi:DUF4870 domain-containing protein [Flavobacterium phycosphaerae]|uniref:DUF4870 domain-containing protein n=1 Tax=Flavobacterium phycosphaerae TaxID=2697515 RepID=UPI00138B12A2|nr:DUF4870 domain-containing protein [Flavobacterium phycosphaerae]
MMTKKTISVISYLTIIGWSIAFIEYEKGAKTSLAKFHLEQSLGLNIIVIVTNILMALPLLLDPFFSILLIINNTGLVILWIAGIISANNGVRLPLPVIGFYFKDKFRFIR